MTVQHNVAANLIENGYAFANGGEVRDLIGESGENWPAFQAHWDDLGQDNYLKSEYMFRLRRYGQVGLVPRTGRVRLREHTAYFQAEEVNQYAGGIVREFTPLLEEFVSNEIFQNLIRTTFEVFAVEDKFRDAEWVVDVTQFRLRVERDRVTQPTPEGIHRDGVPFGAIHMVGRKNIEGGVSHVYTLNKDLIDVGVLRSPLDTLYAWDNRLMHYVTPIFAVNLTEGNRDMLTCGYSLPNSIYDKD